MSDKNNDGGFAFPIVVRDIIFGGMTMRDYFAAKAMQGLTQNMEAWSLQEDSVALEAYKMADAMIRAREAK